MNDQEHGSPDYYQILGVEPNASPAEIVAAFHARAHQHHPDTTQHHDPANRRFKGVVEAYQVLANPIRRRAYDRHRSRQRHRRIVPVQNSPSTTTPHTARWAGIQPATRPGGADIYAELPITPEEARDGGPCVLQVTRLIICSDCGGSEKRTFPPCSTCRGEGRLARRERVRLLLPPGSRAGTRICVRGCGHECSPTRETSQATCRGHLHLRVVVRPCW